MGNDSDAENFGSGYVKITLIGAALFETSVNSRVIHFDGPAVQRQLPNDCFNGFFEIGEKNGKWFTLAKRIERANVVDGNFVYRVRLFPHKRTKLVFIACFEKLPDNVAQYKRNLCTYGKSMHSYFCISKNTVQNGSFSVDTID